MLVNKDFQTRHLIGWQHSRQPIKSHVRKSLLANMEFNIDLLSNPQPRFFKTYWDNHSAMFSEELLIWIDEQIMTSHRPADIIHQNMIMGY